MSAWIEKIELVLGAGLLAIITMLVFVAAVMRFAGHPIIWSVDMAQLLFIWLCFVGATRAMRQRAHLGVDYFIRMFGHKSRLIVETVLAVIFIAVMAKLSIEGYKLAVQNKERLFGDSGISYYFVTMAVPIGFLFLSLAIIANAVDAWRARTDGLLVFTKPPSDDQVSEL